MRLIVHGQLMVNILTEGAESHIRCIKGVPEGSHFAYAIPDFAYGVSVVIEHPSFEDLKDGDLIPIFEPKPELERM